MNIFKCCQPSAAGMRHYLEHHVPRRSGQPRQYADNMVFSLYCDHLDGATIKQLVERYGISDNGVRTIVNRRNYRDVTLRAEIMYLEREQQCQHEAQADE